LIFTFCENYGKLALRHINNFKGKISSNDGRLLTSNIIDTVRFLDNRRFRFLRRGVYTGWPQKVSHYQITKKSY